MIALRLASLAALIAAPALAEIVPTSPSGNTVVTVGQDIDALWTTDSTGQWTDVEIQLMTGDNFQMVPLATLATGIDGTTASSLSIPCPDVSPYSKIYFLQFTLGGNVSTATWTTRFTIASASGETVAPEQSTVYNGETVQWGTGALVGSAPTLITGSGSSDALNSTTPASASASSGSEGSAAQVSTISVAPSASASAASDAMSMSMSMSMSASMSGSASSSASSGSATRAAAASASATPSSAALRGSTVGLGAVVLGLAGLIAV